MELRRVLGGAAVVLGLISAAHAGDAPRAVERPVLEQMGLGGMQPLADAEGEAVKGKGPYAFVFGFVRSGFVTRSYADIGANSASGGRVAFSFGGGVAIGGARARAW